MLRSDHRQALEKFVPPGNFPNGLKVMVVEPDVKCLYRAVLMLEACNFTVVAAQQSAMKAYNSLVEGKTICDVVLIEPLGLDIDGFLMLQSILQQISIPVIILSTITDNSVITSLLNQGVAYYMQKPATMELFKNIWIYVINFKTKLRAATATATARNIITGGISKIPTCIAGNGGEAGASTAGHRAAEEEQERDSSTKWKQTVAWNKFLQDKFEDAINKLGGPDKSTPKKILKIMNVPNLSRSSVASHLQKHRLKLKKSANAAHLGGGKADQPRRSRTSSNHLNHHTTSASTHINPRANLYESSIILPGRLLPAANSQAWTDFLPELLGARTMSQIQLDRRV